MSRRMRRLLDRLRDWWQGEPGRHAPGYTYAINAPRVSEPERDLLDAENELADNLADALLRARYPRLFAPADEYWGPRYVDLFAWSAQQTQARYLYRQSWGLEPETLLDFMPADELAVA